MAILGITTDFAGEIGVIPRLVRLYCNDSLATVLGIGYLQGANTQGITIMPTDFIFVSYVNNGTAICKPQYSNGIITLVQLTPSVATPSIINHIATYTNVNGSLGEDPTTAINGGNIQAGLSGTSGSFFAYSGSTAKGSFRWIATANTGDTITSVTNAAMGQASALTIPDPGTATASITVAPAALVNNNLVKASGTSGLVADAGARIISNTTSSYAGGGTSNAFTATGLTVASVGSAVIRASTNAVSIVKALPGTNTLTITFSGDPGASTTVDYIYTTASQA